MPVLFEKLESRQMMSSSFAVEMVDGIASALMTAKQPSISAPLTRGATPTPSLIGIYRGWVQLSSDFVTRKVSFTAHITRQTQTSLGGSIKVMGKTYRGTVPVRFNGRSFSASYDKGDISGTLTGTIAVDGSKFSGMFNGTAYGFDGSGRFSAMRST